MEQAVNITEIIPTEISGYCDVESGECIIAETGAGHCSTTENSAQTEDEIPTMFQDSEEHRTLR